MTSPNSNQYLPQSLPPLHPEQEKQFALLTHLLSIFFGFIPALVFFVLYKDRGPFVRHHVVTEWNFQLTFLIAQGVGFVIAIAGWASSFATEFGSSADQQGLPTGIVFFFIGYAVILLVMLVRAIFGIIASVAAGRGRFYRYPVAIRFVRA